MVQGTRHSADPAHTESSVSDQQSTAGFTPLKRVRSRMVSQELITPSEMTFFHPIPSTVNTEILSQSTIVDRLNQSLDGVLHELNSTHPSPDTIDRLFLLLNTYRVNVGPIFWKSTVKPSVLTHPIVDFLHQDPCTFRSFSKPRGYAGDAVLIDYLYRLNSDYKSMSRLQRTLLDYVTHRPSGVAVRERVKIAATLISETLKKTPDAKIVALACGHLRELSFMCHPEHLNNSRFVAIDQDDLSLNEVRERYPHLPIQSISASVSDLIRGQHFVETANADLFYALGLFDYLSEPLGQSVVQLMFNRLNPGG